MPVKEVGVELGWGPARLSGTWAPDNAERDAAWELYVELVTRIAVAPMQPGEGILREALRSLYQLFGVTRDILRRYGPTVAKPPRREGDYRFGYLAVWLLNGAVRPVLARWHPELQRWEDSRPPDVSVVDHETSWEHSASLRNELERLRHLLLQYADLLAAVCDAPALIDATRGLLATESSAREPDARPRTTSH
ncbi:hypothetical protein V5D56_13370 [Cellulosimicrobium sp. PMB13]|uniref:hypothetical protein n=1 Tax=Cellulosimicrobium sp. PMB13 TaxID=3120158 RepID=UPI003F4B8A8E